MATLDPISIASAVRGPRSAVEATWPRILAALQDFGIDSPAIQVAAAATMGVECAAWVPQREKRADPNRQPRLWALQERYWPSGFFGRGFVMTTWRENYLALEKATQIPFTAQPDLLLLPQNAAKALAFFFRSHGIPEHALGGDWRGVRYRVNGGYELLDPFLAMVDRLQGVIRG